MSQVKVRQVTEVGSQVLMVTEDGQLYVAQLLILNLTDWDDPNIWKRVKRPEQTRSES